MLTNIPWSQFFLAAGAALVLYYLVILLRYYRHDIKLQLTRILRAGLPAHRPSPSQESILGAASPEAAPPLSPISELRVAPASPGLQQLPYPPEAAAILAEAAALLEGASETQMGKEEFLSLLHLLSERHMPSPDARQAVQRYLLEQAAAKLSFPLTAADISAQD